MDTKRTNRHGFSSIDLLIAITLTGTLIGFATPFVMRTSKTLIHHSKNFLHTDTGILTVLRIQDWMAKAERVEVLSPTHLRIVPKQMGEYDKNIRWERGVLKVQENRFVYPITAIGDVRAISFLPIPPPHLTLRWDQKVFLLRTP